jgi:hypothetical protein
MNNQHITKGLSCHQFAETWTGKEIIETAVDMEYLMDREMVRIKDHRVREGMSENEFLEVMLKDMKEKANA